MKEIIKSLEDLLSLHEELLILSREKTEVLKDSTADELQKLLVRERKLVRKTEQAEASRKSLTDAWYEGNGLSLENAAVTDLLERQTDPEEAKRLEQVTVKLAEVIANLKDQEKLNFALINQSMQFLKVSLDLLSPTLDNMNYGNKAKQEAPSHSVFDSKA